MKNQMESIIDPLRKTLSPDIWSANKLDPSARKAMVNFSNIFLNKHEITAKRLMLTGSMATFRYSPQADLDINIQVEIPDDKLKELTKDLANYNGKPFAGHPMNLFLFNKEWEPGVRGPAYDLTTDKWETDPKKDEGDIPYRSVLEVALSWARKIDLDIGELKRDIQEYEIWKYHLSIIKNLEGVTPEEINDYMEVKKAEIKADLDTLRMDLIMIVKFRKEPFESKERDIKWLIKVTGPDVNFTINNVVYKLLERFGYLEILHKYVSKEVRGEWE